MVNNITLGKCGYVAVKRCVVAGGYHLTLTCHLQAPPAPNASREKYLADYMQAIKTVLDNLRHPGYFRCEERVIGYTTYYLHLVPINRRNMSKYIADFGGDAEAAIQDLQACFCYIDNEERREIATESLHQVMAELAEGDNQ